jgi:hypothetical protein
MMLAMMDILASVVITRALERAPDKSGALTAGARSASVLMPLSILMPAPESTTSFGLMVTAILWFAKDGQLASGVAIGSSRSRTGPPGRRPP